GQIPEEVFPSGFPRPQQLFPQQRLFQHPQAFTLKIKACPSDGESEAHREILRRRSGSGFAAPPTAPETRADQFPRDGWLARVSAAPAGTTLARAPVSTRAR